MYKLLIVTIVYFTLLQNTCAQLYELPNRDTLFSSLRSYHDDKRTAILAEYSAKEKYKWMKWTPQIGVTYTIAGQPRPHVYYNLNQVYTNLNETERIKAKTKTLNLSGELEYKTDSLNLLSILKRIQIAEFNLIGLEAAQKVDDEVWEIQKERYDKKEIPAIQFLSEKRQFIERGEALRRKREEIELLKIDALKAAKL